MNTMKGPVKEIFLKKKARDWLTKNNLTNLHTGPTRQIFTKRLMYKLVTRAILTTKSSYIQILNLI